MPDSTVCLTFDFDALSVWFGYEHGTPAMLARGEYGATFGALPGRPALTGPGRLD